MSTDQTRILHLHIEKCGGTALRNGMARALGPAARVFPKYHERDLEGIVPNDWDVISGHFCWEVLQPLGGRIVTVLRDPIDRFISTYTYLGDMHRADQDKSHRAALSTLYSLDDYTTLRDEQSLIFGLYNHMTWQIAFGSVQQQRKVLRARGLTDAQVLNLAIENLGRCTVVGVQDRLDEFCVQYERKLGTTLTIRRENVTQGRLAQPEISVAIRRRIADWVYLDIELYRAACRLAAAR